MSKLLDNGSYAQNKTFKVTFDVKVNMGHDGLDNSRSMLEVMNVKNQHMN